MPALPPPDADALAHSQRLRELIQEHIFASGGAIPFSRFMELCLYTPGLGYYSAGATKFGEAGDFGTAPELGPLFAACVADALAPVLQQLGPGADFVELGGGSGAFAEVVLKRLLALDGDGRFIRSDRPADALLAAAVRHVERQLEAPFADGYRSELLPQLPYWLQAVIGGLRRGALLFVDYGYGRGEYYAPERRDGTLRAFRGHHVSNDVLALPGLQDITASVDFTALAEAGTHAGFDFSGYCTQASFLLGNGLPQRLQPGRRLHSRRPRSPTRNACSRPTSRAKPIAWKRSPMSVGSVSRLASARSFCSVTSSRAFASASSSRCGKPLPSRKLACVQ